MRDQLRALAKLAEIDESARELDQELRGLPARIEEMKGDLQRLEALLGKEREQLEEAESLKRSHEEQMAQGNEMLARAKAKGAKARNAREAEAAEREMESVRRTLRDRDEEHGRLNEAIETVRSSLEEHQKEFDELRAMFDEEEKNARGRMEELEAERSKVLTGRDEVTAKLKKTLVRRYERIRERRGNAVVEVIDGTCMGCRMQLPPQQYIELQRAEDVQQCANCHRLLFYKAAIED